MKINEIQKEIHEIAKSKGWWDDERHPLEVHMLIVSEVAEATESVRNDEWDLWFMKPDGGKLKTNKDGLKSIPDSYKPEGEATELADALIRILDYAEHKGWDMERIIELKMAYNKTRAYKHGGKTS